MKKRDNTFLTVLASFSISIGALMYLAYGWLPHPYYIPISLALTAVSGLVAYFILVKTIEL